MLLIEVKKKNSSSKLRHYESSHKEYNIFGLMNEKSLFFLSLQDVKVPGQPMKFFLMFARSKFLAQLSPITAQSCCNLLWNNSSYPPLHYYTFQGGPGTSCTHRRDVNSTHAHAQNLLLRLQI